MHSKVYFLYRRVFIVLYRRAYNLCRRVYFLSDIYIVYFLHRRVYLLYRRVYSYIRWVFFISESSFFMSDEGFIFYVAGLIFYIRRFIFISDSLLILNRRVYCSAVIPLQLIVIMYILGFSIIVMHLTNDVASWASTRPLYGRCNKTYTFILFNISFSIPMSCDTDLRQAE